MAVARADERVPIRQSLGRVHLVTESLWPVARLPWRVEERHVEIPYYLARDVVLSHDAVLLMGYEIRSGGGLAGVAGVGVGRGRVDLERDLSHDRARAVHLDDPGRARLHDHRGAVGQALKRVHFDGPRSIPVPLGVILPDEFAVGIEFDDACPAILVEEMAVGQQMEVVDLPTGDLPLDGAVGSDGGQRLGRIVRRDQAADRAGLDGRRVSVGWSLSTVSRFKAQVQALVKRNADLFQRAATAVVPKQPLPAVIDGVGLVARIVIPLVSAGSDDRIAFTLLPPAGGFPRQSPRFVRSGRGGRHAKRGTHRDQRDATQHARNAERESRRFVRVSGCWPCGHAMTSSIGSMCCRDRE